MNRTSYPHEFIIKIYHLNNNWNIHAHTLEMREPVRKKDTHHSHNIRNIHMSLFSFLSESNPKPTDSTQTHTYTKTLAQSKRSELNTVATTTAATTATGKKSHVVPLYARRSSHIYLSLWIICVPYFMLLVCAMDESKGEI